MSTTSSYPEVKWSDVMLLSFVYAMYLVVITAPLGFIVSAVKVYKFKKSAEGGGGVPDQEALLMATHYEWLVRTFIFMAVLVMAGVGLAYYIVGYAVAGVAVIWWFYRVIRGVTSLMAYRSMPATICTQALCYGQGESADA